MGTFLCLINRVILSGGFKKCVQLFSLFIVIEHVKILNKKRRNRISLLRLKIKMIVLCPNYYQSLLCYYIF